TLRNILSFNHDHRLTADFLCANTLALGGNSLRLHVASQTRRKWTIPRREMTDQPTIEKNVPSTVPRIRQRRDSKPREAEASRGFIGVERSAPNGDNGTVGRRSPPKRVRNAERRDREHLTETEVEQLYQTAKQYGRYGQRDALMIWMCFRHGLRVGELVALRWAAHIDFDTGAVRIERLKNGVPSVHPLSERELRGLRRLQQTSQGRYVFTNERGAPV